MSTRLIPAIAILALIVQAGASGAAPSLIPRPAQISQGAGSFQITADTCILFDNDALADAGVPAFLREALSPATGFSGIRIEKVTPGGSPQKNSILLCLTESDAGLGPEGYELDVTAGGIVISAASPAGAFYGIQTLRQLLPPGIFSHTPVHNVAWVVPAVSVKDKPRFAWRGLMLDVSRHIFTADEVKRWIDLLALHKMNTFHWHLTDDQGWRIEIKKYPKLTQVGAWRSESPMKGDRKRGDGTRYGGFFTQDQVRDIVAYARQRFITVVPEIEMPGHALAALTGYPEYSCTGGPFAVRTRWGVEPDVYCAGNDATFAFLEDILSEVIELFPGKFVHIGGDECPKDRWEKCPKCQARIREGGMKDVHELQSYFVQRIEKFLNAKGRRLIGWDEILEGGLAPNAAVMSWRGEKGGIAAAQAGHDVVMTPNSHAYLDYYQSKNPGEPEAIGGFVPLDKVYSYEPVAAAIPGDKRHHVFGFQGNLWTEYIYDFPKAEYMAYPRGAAIAETAWSPAEGKDFADFKKRLTVHLKRLDAMKVNYRRLQPEVPAKKK